MVFEQFSLRTMDNFARLPDAERAVLIKEAAARRNINPIIVEKDFWVCWAMKRLTEHPDLGPNLTFKGGTSLSKAYSIIERFSEDIDLTIRRSAPYVCDVACPMDNGISSNERQRRIKQLKLAAQQYVAAIVMPVFEQKVLTALGSRCGWGLGLDSRDKDDQTILFGYPVLQEFKGAFDPESFDHQAFDTGAYGYILPSIKLEFGARGGTAPSSLKIIRPYLADSFPDQFQDSEISFSTLAVERTFWEKITILHALYHGAKLRSGMSRHYYDAFMLNEKGIADKAKMLTNLLDDVVRNKGLLFSNTKASYDTAKIGSLKLVPEAGLLSDLKSDYKAMSEMFMAAAPDFDTLMRGIVMLESKLNS
jgi:predicted nucleotidyltransferase component of viral defense system